MSTLASPERPPGVPDRPPRHARPWSAWWALAVALGAVVAGGLVYALADALRGALVEAPPRRPGSVGVALAGTPPVLTFAATLAQDLALVAGALLVVAASVKRRMIAAALGLRPTRIASATALVVVGYLAFVVIGALWSSATGVQDRENVALDLGTRDSALAFVGAAFLVSVVAPFAEELFFRGFLFGGLRKHGLLLATLVSGTAFGLAHVASSPIGFIVPLGTLGVILALVYERTRSLYSAIGLHALNNAIAFGVGDGRVWIAPVGLAVALGLAYGLSRAVGAAPAPAAPAGA